MGSDLALSAIFQVLNDLADRSVMNIQIIGNLLKVSYPKH